MSLFHSRSKPLSTINVPRCKSQDLPGILFLGVLAFSIVMAMAGGSRGGEPSAVVYDLGEGTGPSALQRGGPTPAVLTRGCTGPRLYDNTVMCTPFVHSIAVGGTFHPPPSLWVRDWFVTSGGQVSGFDLYVVNGGPGAVPNHIHLMRFFRGTDANNLGTAIEEPPLAGFSTRMTPELPPVPVHRDPMTGEPRVMRVSVDYIARTYTIADAETGDVLVGPEDISDRREPFRLPPGKTGFEVRFTGEDSLCAGGQPVCGVALAKGGSGNENGVHFVNAELCPEELWPLVCDNVYWAPLDRDTGAPVPCTGGDVCSLDRPHFGIALTLYAGPNEDADCNNDLGSADPIVMNRPDTSDPPRSCSSGRVSVSGYLGDTGCSYTFEPDDFFDADDDGDVDLHDFGSMQACFEREGLLPFPCRVHDDNADGGVNLDDFFGFLICSTFAPGDPMCSGFVPEPPVPLQDIDLYKIPDLEAGDVLSVLVEGEKSPSAGPTWDPYVKIFRLQGGSLVQLAASDDFERSSFDSYTTVEVPAGVVTLYVGVSAAEHADYPTNDPPTVPVLAPEQAGGYTLTLVLTDPDCVADTSSGAPSDCYESKHEPDDTIADADARGDISEFVLIGAIGDGAFAGTGQDVDIYRLSLDGDLATARSLTVRAAGGFDTAFDLAMALYDSAGELVATGDQASVSALAGLDQSRPQLAATVSGTDHGGDGVYYIAVFGTDRGLFDEDCRPMFPAVPPSLLNFPHGDQLPATSESDLRPTTGGRVNKPSEMLAGCSVDPDADPPPTLQCYRLSVLPSPEPLGLIGDPDVDETATPHGNDSIMHAATSVTAGDRLANPHVAIRTLGNGPYGGWQGDVDFYATPVSPGDVITVNVAPAKPASEADAPVRPYLALLDGNGHLLDAPSLSLERGTLLWTYPYRELEDQLAAVLGASIPDHVNGTVYAMVGIDNGNLSPAENMPFNPLQPGTTLSRRFETKSMRARPYVMSMAAMPPVESIAGTPRMFVVPQAGIDEKHVFCALGTELDSTPMCYPPILEIDPITGFTRKLIDGEPSFRPWRSAGEFAVAGAEVASANLLIAWDGEFLWVAKEKCQEPLFCENQIRHLFKVDPDKPHTSAEYIESLGQIRGFPTVESKYTGMTEIGGFLYALDNTTNTFRYWDKALEPTATNGGNMTPAPSDETDDPRWNDLYGDIGTNGHRLYVPCSWQEFDPDTGEVTGTGEYGLCVFTPDPIADTITFVEKRPDPVTNSLLTPGPRLGGVDILNGDTLIATDRNGPIVEHQNLTTGEVRALVLPRGFVVDRLTIR